LSFDVRVLRLSEAVVDQGATRSRSVCFRVSIPRNDQVDAASQDNPPRGLDIVIRFRIVHPDCFHQCIDPECVQLRSHIESLSPMCSGDSLQFPRRLVAAQSEFNQMLDAAPDQPVLLLHVDVSKHRSNSRGSFRKSRIEVVKEVLTVVAASAKAGPNNVFGQLPETLRWLVIGFVLRLW
jgi:hypothetical protein